MKLLTLLAALTLSTFGGATSDEQTYFGKVNHLVKEVGMRYAPSDFCSAVFREHADIFQSTYVTSLPFKMKGINFQNTRNAVSRITDYHAEVMWNSQWKSPVYRYMTYRNNIDLLLLFSVEDFSNYNLSKSSVGFIPAETSVCVTVIDYGRLK